MTYEGLGEMFEGDFADKYADKFPLNLMGGKADPSSLHRPGVRNPIFPSGNLILKCQNNKNGQVKQICLSVEVDRKSFQRKICLFPAFSQLYLAAGYFRLLISYLIGTWTDSIGTINKFPGN